MSNYVVTVNTGVESTDFDVSIKLIGSNGKEFETKLDLSKLTYSTQSSKRGETKEKANLFEKNEKDIFTITHTESIGDLTSVVVKTIKKGALSMMGVGDNWALKNIMVETPEKKMFMFTYNKVIINTEPVTIPKDTTDISDYIYYNIEIKTANVDNAGTNANITIQLLGTDGTSESLPLISETNIDSWEQNQTDKMKVFHKNLGNLNRITLFSDNTGANPDWLVESVSITPQKIGEVPTEAFVFNNTNKVYINEKNNNFLTLEQGDQPVPIIPNQVEYMVNVTTSSKKGAGTNSNITLVLYGDNNTEAEVKLTKEISVEPKNNDLFESGKLDKFKFQANDIGEKLNKIKVISDGAGFGIDWEIDDIWVNGGNLLKAESFKYTGGVITKGEKVLFPGENALVKSDASNSSTDTSTDTTSSVSNSPKKESLASILRATAAQEYITQQLRTQFASLTGQLAEKCNKCNTIIPTVWKSNECDEVCIPLEETAANNRGLFKKRSELLKQLESVTTPQLVKILPNSKDREYFYGKFFYERLKQTGSFEDSMIDMNDKLEDFIKKVEDIHKEYETKDSDLSSSTDERIKKNTKIQINYDKSPVEYYFKPTQETFDDFNTLSSNVSSLSDEQMYCKRKKWLSCAVREHKCDWIGERNDKFKCQPKASSGGPPAPGALPPCVDPADPGKGTTCSGGSRNISKQKKKVIRNLSKRRYF